MTEETQTTEQPQARPQGEYAARGPRRERDEREGAPVEVVLRRFFRDVQQSDIMTEIKRRKYYEKSPTRSARRRAAHGKMARRAKRDF